VSSKEDRHLAKLKGPLFSLGATQQLGKALVFFGWKGLDVVREYVVPANPKTAAQTTQRGHLANAVTRVHWAQARATNPLDSEDVMAYALRGSIEATPRTWFNQAVKMMVDCLVAGKNYPIYYDGHATPGASQLGLQLYAHLNAPTAGKFFWGTSKTALINSIAATIAGSSISKTIPGLTTGVKYYVQFRADSGDPAEGSYSGIYYGTPT